MRSATEWLRGSGSPADHLISTLCLKQGEQEQAPQGHNHSGFEYLQGWWFHNLSEQPVALFDHSHDKESFSQVWTEFFMVYPLLLVLSEDVTGRSLASSSLLCPIKCLYTLVRSFLSLLSSRVNISSSSRQISDAPHLSLPLWLFAGLIPACPYLFCDGEPRMELSFGGVLEMYKYKF